MIPHKVKLSGELAAIAEIIGFGPALRLASDFGGIEIEIPKNPKKGQQLASSIGLEAAIKLSENYGTGKIEIPLGPSGSYRRHLNQQAEYIQKGLSKGKSGRQIARELGTTERTVRRHKNQKPDRSQPRFPFETS